MRSAKNPRAEGVAVDAKTSSPTALTANNPYDEAADAKLEIRQALATATNIPVMVVFGGNWCGDCKALEAAMKQGASARLLAGACKVVKVNVGHFDQNVALAKSYGVPLEKGIPTIVILSPRNEVLYATREGELADARKMGDDGIYQFFKRIAVLSQRKE